MAKLKTFDYERFLKLSGTELIEYMEPLVYDSNVVVSADVIERLLDESDSLDAYHLVYALEFGTRRNPKTFAWILPQYLMHQEQSVRLTAEALLRRLPESCVTPGVANSVQQA
ncbi:MAG: hypothetical protein O3A00_14605 [Planctomycetota bacterium]|nr:hypothetical protein [Planctomycetota bacterium]